MILFLDVMSLKGASAIPSRDPSLPAGRPSPRISSVVYNE